MIVQRVKEAAGLAVRIKSKRLALFFLMVWCYKMNRLWLTFISFIPIIKTGDCNEN